MRNRKRGNTEPITGKQQNHCCKAVIRVAKKYARTKDDMQRVFEHATKFEQLLTQTCLDIVHDKRPVLTSVHKARKKRRCRGVVKADRALQSVSENRITDPQRRKFRSMVVSAIKKAKLTKQTMQTVINDTQTLVSAVHFFMAQIFPQNEKKGGNAIISVVG